MKNSLHLSCLAASFFAFAGSVSAQTAPPAPTAAPAPINATAAVNITPLRVDMTSTKEADQLLLRNDSAMPLTVQIRLFGWNQGDGSDVYAPNQDFVVSPSIITIAPQSTQTLHVVPNGQRDSMTERTYRIVVDQIIAKQVQAGGVTQTRLRMTIPLFSGGEQASAANMEYVIKGNRLYVTNKGGRGASFAPMNVQFGAANAAPVSLQNSPRYVLSQSTMSVAMPANFICGGNPVNISGMIDSKPFNVVATQNCT